MKIKILRSRQGEVVATVETGSAQSVVASPEVSGEMTVDETDVPDHYLSRLEVFYKEARKKPLGTDQSKS